MHLSRPNIKSIGRYAVFVTAMLFSFAPVVAQDNCATATNITLPGGGFGIGLVISPVRSVIGATLQPGESFAAANTAAGQTDKTIWYKFNLPTSRQVTIQLSQNTSAITPGDAGFVVYKTSNCLPGSIDLSTQLDAVTAFGSTSSNCLQPGDYLIQVAAKSSANGTVYFQIQTALPGTSPYDFANSPYDFGVLSAGVSTISFPVECQTIDNSSEVCTSLPRYTEYNKTTWQVFTTPAYFDYISLILANQTLAAGQTYGFNIYKGDVRSSAGSLVYGCNSITSNASKSAQKTFTCTDLDPNTTYSIQIFYHQTFTDNVQLSLVTGGTTVTAAPKPLLLSMPVSNTTMITPSASGSSVVLSDYLACNSRHSATNCPPSLPLAGINYNDRNFDLSSFFTFTLTSSAALNISGNPSCGPPLLIQLYKQDLTNNCSDLSKVNIVKESIGSTSASCLSPGNYVVQVSGTDSSIANTYAYGALSNSGTELCLLSNLGSPFSLNITATTPSAITETIDSSLCSDQTYTLSNGTIVNTSNIYRDTLRTINGCDSLIRIVDLSFKNKTVRSLSVNICSGASYTLPSGKNITTAGTYNDTLHYISGCDSVINIITVSAQPVIHQLIDTSICEHNSYTLPSGVMATTTGNYFDTVRYSSGCDSLVTELRLTVKNSATQNLNVIICADQNYTLPSGIIVNTAGQYKDTLRYSNGCDSIIRIVQVTVNSPSVQSVSATICDGASYTLPSGITVNSAGIYRDTLHFLNGCDSLIRIVDLSVSPVLRKQSSISLCEGSSVSLPWGTIISTPGIYHDTLRYINGCDSIINEVTVLLNTITRIDTTVSFCAGSSYILPWGAAVNIAGTYRDTLHYLSGCDSVIRTVQLTANTLITITSAASVCSNQSFTLPWGTIVSAAGIYRDTLRYASGCDSVIRVVDLSVNTPAKQSIDTSICFDAIYTLPWGTVAALPGTYTDTVHAIGGCDSLIRIVNLSIALLTMKDTAAVLCNGQFFLSPSGNKIYTSGVYSDTLRYSSGCDSMIILITITIKPTIYKTIDAVICSGNWFTTPSGKNLSTAGTFLDTLQYTTGCDSLIATINLSVLTTQTQNTNASVCIGKSFMLPWGTVITAPGIYRDTLKFISGCDSVIRIVQVSNYAPTHLKLNSGICAGQVYIFPSGKQVTTAGNFSDTIHNAAGCDSLIYNISLTSLTPVTQISNVVICPGNSYTLPWGIVENSPGVYRDTVRSESGCDSLYRVVNLAISVPVQKNYTVSICDGVGYSLPSGKKVFSSGIYRDTVFSASGCDSLITNLTLIVQTAITQIKQVSICSGQVYTLPSGNIVNAAGNYRDTLKYTTGCDSLIQIINVQTIIGKTVSTTASFCRGENYILPWGTVVNDSGHYCDTLRSNGGCDSLIYVVNLSVKERPLMSVTKSNDINCTLGSARLTATGGNQYLWSPATGLDKTDVFNPVAAPTITTLYHVKATSTYGCSSEDSILVLVTTANSGESFLMPNAFTPNGDNVNDYFGVQHWGSISDLHFSIYDRWGKLVFYTENPSQRWDGNIKDKLLPSGTYVYAITAKTLCGDVLRKGTVTLIR